MSTSSAGGGGSCQPGSSASSATSLLVAVRTQIGTVGGRIGLGFLGVSAFGLLLAGLFRSDSLLAETGTLTGTIHSVGAVLGGFVPLAAYLIAWSIARNVAWRPRRTTLWWVTIPAIAASIASTWQQFVVASGGGEFGPTVLVGWPNRLFVVAMATWLLVAAALVLRLTSRGSVSPPGVRRTRTPAQAGPGHRESRQP